MNRTSAVTDILSGIKSLGLLRLRGSLLAGVTGAEKEAGAETVTSQLMSSDSHSKFRQLTAYLQLSAEGPFSACGRTLETYARHAKTPGFSPQTMMDGEWVDKCPSAFACQLEQLCIPG